MKQFDNVKDIIDETIKKRKRLDYDGYKLPRPWPGMKVLNVKSLVLKYCMIRSIITKHGKLFMPEI